MLPRTSFQRHRTWAISGRLYQTACTNNPSLIFRAGADHRLDFYARTDSCSRTPGPLLDIGFRPLSSLRNAGFCLALALPCVDQKSERPHGTYSSVVFGSSVDDRREPNRVEAG